MKTKFDLWLQLGDRYGSDAHAVIDCIEMHPDARLLGRMAQALSCTDRRLLHPRHSQLKTTASDLRRAWPGRCRRARIVQP